MAKRRNGETEIRKWRNRETEKNNRETEKQNEVRRRKTSYVAEVALLQVF